MFCSLNGVREFCPTTHDTLSLSAQSENVFEMGGLHVTKIFYARSEVFEHTVPLTYHTVPCIFLDIEETSLFQKALRLD